MVLNELKKLINISKILKLTLTKTIITKDVLFLILFNPTSKFVLAISKSELKSLRKNFIFKFLWPNWSQLSYFTNENSSSDLIVYRLIPYRLFSTFPCFTFVVERIFTAGIIHAEGSSFEKPKNRKLGHLIEKPFFENCCFEFLT